MIVTSAAEPTMSLGSVPAELLVIVLVVTCILAVILWATVATMRNAPDIIEWYPRPLGREPAMIEWHNKMYVCIPIEGTMNSLQAVNDVLQAAETLRDERLAKERTKLPG